MAIHLDRDITEILSEYGKENEKKTKNESPFKRINNDLNIGIGMKMLGGLSAEIKLFNFAYTSILLQIFENDEKNEETKQICYINTEKENKWELELTKIEGKKRIQLFFN